MNSSLARNALISDGLPDDGLRVEHALDLTDSFLETLGAEVLAIVSIARPIERLYVQERIAANESTG